MTADPVCLERERLLGQLSEALTGHNEAVSKMVELAGLNRPKAFGEAKAEVERTKRQVQEARQELDAHVREHGCQQFAPPPRAAH